MTSACPALTHQSVSTEHQTSATIHLSVGTMAGHPRGGCNMYTIHYLLSLVLVLAPTLAFHVSTQTTNRREKRLYPLPATSPSHKPDDEKEEQQEKHNSFPYLESPMDNERRPRRLNSPPIEKKQIYPWNDWGVQPESPEPIFPFSVGAVTHAAWEAVAATLYNKQKMDPNVVQNIMRGDTVHGRRPVRSLKDAGRLGIEIDGTSCLFRGETDATAIRLVALKLAGRLSQSPWEGYETDESNGNRPVVVYFNTIKQALAASYELKLLKQIEQEHSKHGESPTTTCYDEVTILCLGQQDGLPEHLKKKRHKNRKNYDTLSSGVVDPTRGIVLVVQPTDYNAEYRPPGPSVGTVENLQGLVAAAAIEEIPAVVLSPRFLANEIPYTGSWEQSGYQQSAIYGGVEPPRGPTPWVMRDFSPPIFSWVGSALPLSLRQTGEFHGHHGAVCRYTGVGLMQTVMHEGHSWHLFGARECEQEKRAHWDISHDYIASTKTASGRPTREIMWRLFGEFAPF